MLGCVEGFACPFISGNPIQEFSIADTVCFCEERLGFFQLKTLQYKQPHISDNDEKKLNRGLVVTTSQGIINCHILLLERQHALLHPTYD